MQEGSQPLARRGALGQPLPYRLQALFLDRATGDFQAEHHWPMAHPSAGILCAPGGNFIVATRERLTLYSSALHLRNSLTLSDPRTWDLVNLFQSADGESLLAAYGPSSPGPRNIDAAHIDEYLRSVRWLYWWVNGDDLRLKREWIAGIEAPTTISSTEIITTRGSREPGGLAVMAGSPGGPTHPISEGGDTYGTPRFVSDHTLALLQAHRLTLITSKGEPMLSEEFPREDWLGTGGHFALRTSQGQTRFAITVWGIRGGSAILDISGHGYLKRVMVFDLPSHKWVYTLDAKKQHIKTISGLALSPNGSLLALIDQDGILQVYRLPPEPG